MIYLPWILVVGYLHNCVLVIQKTKQEKDKKTK